MSSSDNKTVGEVVSFIPLGDVIPDKLLACILIPFLFLLLIFINAVSHFRTKDGKQAAKKRSPSDFLKSVLGRPVCVKLNSGIEYRGVLASLDGYLNIAMEQTEEYFDGQLKAKYGKK